MNREVFLTLFDKNLDEFKESFEYSRDKIIEAVIFYQEDENLGEILEVIRDAEIEDNIKILTNLIFLYPFSSSLLEKIVREIDVNQLNIDKKLEVIWNSNEVFNNFLKRLRLSLRDSNLTNNFFDVIEKNENVLNKLQKEKDNLLRKKSQEKRIEKLKEEIEALKKELSVNNTKELEKKLSFYKNKKNELEKIKKFINHNKKLFEKLMKDKA